MSPESQRPVSYVCKWFQSPPQEVLAGWQRKHNALLPIRVKVKSDQTRHSHQLLLPSGLFLGPSFLHTLLVTSVSTSGMKCPRRDAAWRHTAAHLTDPSISNSSSSVVGKLRFSLNNPFLLHVQLTFCMSLTPLPAPPGKIPIRVK